jgi:soluble lytic murein transglycosylase-like protein
MLFDPEKNIEMASLYLDILFAAYDDTKLVLAEYNGGPRNAAFFNAGSSRVSQETKDYVAKVLDVRHRLENRFEYGIDVPEVVADIGRTPGS